jgi:hypothetical protein
MVNESFSIHLQKFDGIKIWEMDGVPQPNDVYSNTAFYHGQKNVENLIKIINQKAFMDHEDRFLYPLFSIFESSLMQGVEDEGVVQWDDRSHYTRISWTSYSWKLPPDIKKRMMDIEITKVGGNGQVGEIKIPLKKIADNGGDIQIPPRFMSKLNLRNGDIVKIKMRFCN